MLKNCFILVGELSAQEHAVSFLPKIIKANPDVHFWGVGGEYMRSLQVETIYDLKDFSSMGFTEVYKKFNFYKEARRNLLEEIKRRQTKVAILVDFQGFNMSLLKPLNDLGVKVLYFVAPQAWAWKSWRTYLLKKYVSVLYCILPFEESWFKERGVEQAVTVAHPSYQTFNKEMQNALPVENKKTILWLPGSRKSEIQLHLPLFFKVKKQLEETYPDIKHAIVCSPALFELGYEKMLDESWIKYEAPQLALALTNTMLAIAVSGTVTLNCAFMEVPTIVCYKASMINAWIFRTFVDYKGFVSLPNLLLNKAVFPELLQENCNQQSIFWSAKKFIDDSSLRIKTQVALKELKFFQQKLSESAADSMNLYLK